MKKWILWICVLMGCLPLLLGAYQETQQMGWTALRSGVTADDTALDGTTEGYTFAFGDKPVLSPSGPLLKVHPYWNNVQLYFAGTDAANETCNFKLYAWRQDGPATLICSGTFTLGTAVTGTANTYYADTITVTDVWPTELVVSNSGTNGVCTLAFDALGFMYIYCEIDIPASSQVASASAYISGF